MTPTSQIMEVGSLCYQRQQSSMLPSSTNTQRAILSLLMREDKPWRQHPDWSGHLILLAYCCSNSQRLPWLTQISLLKYLLGALLPWVSLFLGKAILRKKVRCLVQCFSIQKNKGYIPSLFVLKRLRIQAWTYIFHWIMHSKRFSSESLTPQISTPFNRIFFWQKFSKFVGFFLTCTAKLVLAI